MSKKKSNPSLTAFLIGILFIFVGGGTVGLSLIFGSDATDNKQLFDIIMYVGIGVAALGIVLLISGIVSGKRRRKSKQEKPTEAEVKHIEVVGTPAVEPTYVYEPDTYEFVTVGRRQSLEDKFDQIGKMGKTQFVIYVARLFSLKGYEVQLTPVIDNNNIDMLVKRDGVTRAVGCLIADKVMCQENIKPVYDGMSFYKADGAMAVTNMYFDRTALDFAKSRKMMLVDRNILSDQFMN